MLAVTVLLSMLVACASGGLGGDVPTGRGGDPSDPSPSSPDAPGIDAGGSSSPDPGPGDPGDDPGTPPDGDMRCGAFAPAGVMHAPPPPAYSGGTCPTLAPGRNVLTSSGARRELLLIVPEGYDPATERVPLVVLWHHIAGDASALARDVQAQANADELRFIAAIPEKKGDLTISIAGYSFDPVWPYLEATSADRLREEVVFFDDMLSCIAAAYAIDTDCVSTGGVSSGGLFVPQLIERRSDRLASAIIVAGGIGPATSYGSDVRGFTSAAHRLPVLIGWGGDDTCGVDFARASRNFEARLDGHFLMECIHNCGHGPPPVDDPAYGLSLVWNFVFDHPFWLPDGRSPYLDNGFREGTPSWCGIGAGSAVPRTGSCPSTTSCSFPSL